MIGIMKAFALTGGDWVIYLLFGCSVLAVGVMFDRGRVLYEEFLKFEALAPSFLKALDGGKPADVLKDPRGAGARVLAAAVDGNDAGFADRLAAAQSEERRFLEKRLLILGTLGNNAPFIGLFGTVLGVIKAFADLAAQADAGPEVVMAGLSEALIATAVGLLVAIPSVIAFNILQNKAEELLTRADELARRFAAGRSR